MNPSETLEKISESMGSKANVRSVFGEPIHVEGKTVVPVAKIAYGFGAGGGHGPGGQGEGGGGGGGVRAVPAGVLEISPSGTRFIAYPGLRWIVGAFAAGFVLGPLFFHRPRP